MLSCTLALSYDLPNPVLTLRRFYLLVVMDARKQRRTRKRYTTKSRLDSMAVTDVRSVRVVVRFRERAVC